MKPLIPLLTTLLCTAAALADVARPVLQSSTTKALVDDLSTGGKKISISATGTLEFVSGATITGGSVLKAALSLNNVENTALSTWAGSTNITTINPAQSISKLSNLTGNGFVKTSAADGTLVIDSNTYITSSTAIATFQVKYTNLDSFGNLANAAGFLFNNGSGTFSYVSSVPVANGGTGQTSYTNGQILIGNTTGNTLTKATLTAGAGISITNGAGSITIATSGLVIGTNVQAYDADLTTWAGITPGTGVGTLLGTPTLSNLNAMVSDADLASTGANTFTGQQIINVSIPDYNQPSLRIMSDYAALHVTNSVGDKALTIHGEIMGLGLVTGANNAYFGLGSILPGYTYQFGLGLGSGAGITWSGSGYYYGAPEIFQARLGAHHLMQMGGTNAQSSSVMNTFTSATNYEAVQIGWTANVAHLWTIKGSGGGSARDLVLGRDGTVKMTIGANTTDHVQPVKLPSYIVSGLPSAATCGAGSMAFVTDATATTAYSTVAGGGSNKVLVISDGTNWIIH